MNEASQEETLSIREGITPRQGVLGERALLFSIVITFFPGLL